MRLVAVHAGDAALEHAALQERTPGVDLFALLAVGVVVGRGQQRQAMRVLERRGGVLALGDRGAARMAGGAHVHDLRIRGVVALRGLRAAAGELPRLAPAALQHRESLVAVLGVGRLRSFAHARWRDAGP